MPSVLSHTHFGTIWIVRFAALGALAVCWPLPPRVARPVVLLLAVGLGLTTTLTGHAADWGDFSASVLVDFGHVLAASVWIGGLFALALVIFPRVSEWPTARVATVTRKFSRLAGFCLALVVLSGTYNAWTQVRVLPALWTTTYGRVLLAKIAVALAVASLGALNRFAVLPGFADTRPSRIAQPVTRMLSHLTATSESGSPEHLRARLMRYVAAEAALGILILACTAVLTESTPGRHAIRMQHQGHTNAED
jgi:putative copper resistance protein D